MVNLENLCNLLTREGIDFVTGVPDTLLNDFCLSLDSHWRAPLHVIAANEGNAIALAAGYHLATRTVPLVYMQNSGMGNAMNPLISLTDPEVYSIPMVLLIGWRGEPGSGDWPQHRRQGELSPTLLDTLQIPYRVLEPDDAQCSNAFSWATQAARESNRPTALLVRKGVLAQKEKASFDAAGEKYQLSRENAIRAIVSTAPKGTVFVASTGRITRELHAIREELGQPHDCDFLNVGAMGHTLSIATGIAAARPDRSVICLDGDGAAIMHLGSLPVTSNLPISNLIHIVLNNGAHESVGGQPSVGYSVNLTAMAEAAGYDTLSSPVETADALTQAMGPMLDSQRPVFLEARIRKGMRPDMPILKVDLEEQKMALMQNLASSEGKTS